MKLPDLSSLDDDALFSLGDNALVFKYIKDTGTRWAAINNVPVVILDSLIDIDDLSDSNMVSQALVQAAKPARIISGVPHQSVVVAHNANISQGSVYVFATIRITPLP